MTRIPRRTALLASAALALPLLAACGGAAQPGAAATIGSASVSTSDLTARVDRSLTDPSAKQRFGADRASFERRTLTLMIDHYLIQEAARQEQVSVTDAEVRARLAAFAQQAGGMTQLEQQAASAGVAKVDLEPYVRDLTLTGKVGEKLVANVSVPQAQLLAAWRQQFVQVHARHILVKTKAQADSLLAQVKADPKRFAALAKQYSIDTGSKVNGGDLGTQAPSGFVAPFAAAVSSAPVGSFVEVQTQFGWHVIEVLSRKETKSLAAATPELRAQLLQQTQQQKVGQLLGDISKRLKVSVNPRFGTWNATKGQVDPPANQLSTPAPSSSQSG